MNLLVRTCKDCKSEFETTQQKRKFCPQCVIKRRRQKSREYYQRHKDAIKVYQQKYREEHREYFTNYFKNYDAIHKVQKTLRNKNYQIKNKAKFKIKSYKYSDKRYGRGYDPANYITVEWIENQLKLCNMKCCYCRCELSDDFENTKYDPTQWSIDRKDNNIGHIPSNSVVSCLSCNNKRHYKTPYDEYMKKFEKHENVKSIAENYDKIINDLSKNT